MFKDYVSKFQIMVENQNARMENDGFLVGDYVEFRKNFNPEKHPWTARRGEEYLKAVRSLMTAGLPLRVAEMYSDNHPPTWGGELGALDVKSAPRILSIYQEDMPMGKLIGQIVPVPAEVMKVVDTGANLAPEHNWAKDEKITITPEEVTAGDENHKNPKSNVKIPASSAREPVVAKAKVYK